MKYHGCWSKNQDEISIIKSNFFNIKKFFLKSVLKSYAHRKIVSLIWKYNIRGLRNFRLIQITSDLSCLLIKINTTCFLFTLVINKFLTFYKQYNLTRILYVFNDD